MGSERGGFAGSEDGSGAGSHGIPVASERQAQSPLEPPDRNAARRHLAPRPVSGLRTVEGSTVTLL